MKVLVVDDDELVRMMMVQALKDAGYETEESVDGSDAIAKLESNVYDIVVTDVVMPNCSGMSVAEHVKNKNLPTAVLAVSSFADEEGGSLLDTMLYYADDTLQKPFDSENFLRAVRGLPAGSDVDVALQNL